MTEKIYTNIIPEIIDKVIKMKGFAVESKAGSCIKIENDIVFIQSVSSWEEKYLGKEVLVKGLLKKKKIIPDVVVDENGAISQGAAGMQFILEDVEEIIVISNEMQ